MKRTPLRPGKPLERGKPIPKVNRDRKKRRQDAGEVYGPYFTWACNLPCAVIRIGECWGASTAHHVKTVGSGGKDLDGLIPLCSKHHAELHQIGALRFEERYRISLGIEAIYTREKYEREAA